MGPSNTNGYPEEGWDWTVDAKGQFYEVFEVFVDSATSDLGKIHRAVLLNYSIYAWSHRFANELSEKLEPLYMKMITLDYVQIPFSPRLRALCMHIRGYQPSKLNLKAKWMMEHYKGKSGVELILDDWTDEDILLGILTALSLANEEDDSQ